MSDASKESNHGKCRASTATTASDMVEALLGIASEMSPNDLDWVRKIDDTASEFDYFEGFTERQEEVILNIYKRYF